MYTIKPALTALAIEVAIATPATLILKTMTRTRLRMVFTIPATTNIYNGRRVSPILLNMAEPKLNIMKNGMPKKYMRRYVTAISRTSGGVSINSRIGRATHIPNTIRNSPLTTATMPTVLTAS